MYSSIIEGLNFINIEGGKEMENYKKCCERLLDLFQSKEFVMLNKLLTPQINESADEQFRIFQKFGVEAEWSGEHIFEITGGEYRSGEIDFFIINLKVEGKFTKIRLYQLSDDFKDDEEQDVYFELTKNAELFLNYLDAKIYKKTGIESVEELRNLYFNNPEILIGIRGALNFDADGIAPDGFWAV